MARTVILLKACYHKELRPSVTKWCKGSIDSEQESMESDTNKTDEVLKYYKEVDEQEIILKEIGNESTFLLGASSQFGRSINFNRKFFWKFLEVGIIHDSLQNFYK